MRRIRSAIRRLIMAEEDRDQATRASAELKSIIEALIFASPEPLTPKEFLIRFGLNDLADLPRVEDMADALGLDAPLLIEQPTREEDLPLVEPDADGSGESIH